MGLPTDRPMVLTVRRLARRMGLQELVSAFAMVRQRVPDALLAIVGGGALRPALEAQIDGLGLTGSVRLLGRVEDAVLPTLFRAADLSVVPSSALEGFGLTSVEFARGGTPPLVTPVGGLPEVVRGLSESLGVRRYGGALPRGRDDRGPARPGGAAIAEPPAPPMPRNASPGRQSSAEPARSIGEAIA